MSVFSDFLSNLGPNISRGVNFLTGQTDASERSQEFAREQMRFQKFMSDTAYQRGTADLRAAGLNPILVAGGGSAASTPGGASGTAGASENFLSQAVSSALTARRLKEELKLIDQQRETLWAQGQKAWSEKYVADSVVDRVRAETNEREASAKLLQLDIPRAENRAKVEETDVGKYGAIVDRIVDTIGRVFGIRGSARSYAR